jgi:hypothetical protein
MKKIMLLLTVISFAVGAHAQQLTAAQKAAAAAASTTAPVQEAKPAPAPKPKKPTNWKTSLRNQINFGQTTLTNWAAGGDNTVTLQAFVDGNANYSKGGMFWNNRLQLEYGFTYASSKPILQKSNDRIYFESKWGLRMEKAKKIYFSANYDFRSQFSNTFSYPTPSAPQDAPEGWEPKRKDWLNAKKIKSGFFAPAYTNLGLGIDMNPFKWVSINFAPLTGGFVVVRDKALRANYGMGLKEEYEGVDKSTLNAEELEKYEAAMSSGAARKMSRFEFGAKLKANSALKVNDNVNYTSQLVLFSNYLKNPENLRVNWDNKLDWKLAKYFSLTVTTNLIYDDNVLIWSEKDNLKRQRVQFKEAVLLGFTYTIAGK